MVFFPSKRMVMLPSAPAPIDFGHLIGSSRHVFDSGRSYVRAEPVKRDLLGLALYRVNLFQTAGIMTIEGQPVPVRFKHFAYEEGTGTLQDRPLAVYQRVSLNPFSRQTYRIASDLDGRGIENQNGYVLTDVAEARMKFPYADARYYQFLTTPAGQLPERSLWERVKSPRAPKKTFQRDARLRDNVNDKYVTSLSQDDPAYIHASNIKAIDMKLIKGHQLINPHTGERVDAKKFAPDLIVPGSISSRQITKLSGTVYSKTEGANGPILTYRNWQAALAPHLQQ